MQTFDWPIRPQCTWVKCREQLTCLCTWTDVARSWCLAFKKNMWMKTLQDFYSIQVKSWHLYEATNRKITNFTYLLVLANSAWIRSSFCLQTFTSSALGSSYFLRRFFIPRHKHFPVIHLSRTLVRETSSMSPPCGCKMEGAVYLRLMDSYIFESVSLSPLSPKHSVR